MPSAISVVEIRQGPTGPAGSDASVTAANVQTALAADPSGARDEIELGYILDPRDFGTVTTGTGLTTLQRTANTTAIQACLDAAEGKIVQFVNGPFEINDTLLIRKRGIRIYGTSYHEQTGNTSKVIQTAVNKDVFKAIPVDGELSNGYVTIEDLYVQCPTAGTTTGFGFNSGQDPALEPFTDFFSFNRCQAFGGRAGWNLTKFSNASLQNCLAYQGYDGVHIGGNSNSVTFISCQFNGMNAAGSAIYVRGSGYIQVIGCEYGNGGRFVGFESGAIGMTLDVFKLAIERQATPSVIASNNTLNLYGVRLLGGYPADPSNTADNASANATPFVYEGGSFGRIENDNMSGFGEGVAATVTISNASPGVVTWTGHSCIAGRRVRFSTTGTLPSGITAGKIYYVLSTGLTANTFRISEERGGTAINTSSAGSGTHTATMVKPPIAEGTLASVPQRANNQFTTTTPSPSYVEIHFDNSLNLVQWRYAFSEGIGIADDATTPESSEFWRGSLRYLFAREALGVNGKDRVQILAKTDGVFEFQDILNSTLRTSTNITGTSGTLVSNSTVIANDASTRTQRVLPLAPKVGDEIKVIVYGAAGIRINQQATSSTTIMMPDGTETTANSGYLTAEKGASFTLRCTFSSGGGYWNVINASGTLARF